MTWNYVWFLPDKFINMVFETFHSPPYLLFQTYLLPLSPLHCLLCSLNGILEIIWACFEFSKLYALVENCHIWNVTTSNFLGLLSSSTLLFSMKSLLTLSLTCLPLLERINDAFSCVHLKSIIVCCWHLILILFLTGYRDLSDQVSMLYSPILPSGLAQSLITGNCSTT